MAGTISYQSQIGLSNGTLTDAYSVSQGSGTQTTALLVRNVQVIPFAADAALDLGSVVNPGFAMFANLDSTNYVEVGIDIGAVFYPFLRLGPGEKHGPMKLTPGLVPYAKANTAAVSLFYIIYNS